MKLRSSAPIVPGTALLVVLGLLLILRHEAANDRVAIDTAFSDLEQALHVRDSLMPDLIQAARAYAGEEKSTFDGVDTARAAMQSAHTPAEIVAADEPLQIALSRLLLIEALHPDLSSDRDLARLEGRLKDAESRIALSKRRCNEAVEKYNAGISGFPGNIAAALLGLHPEDLYFKADVAEVSSSYTR